MKKLVCSVLLFCVTVCMSFAKGKLILNYTEYVHTLPAQREQFVFDCESYLCPAMVHFLKPIIIFTLCDGSTITVPASYRDWVYIEESEGVSYER